MSNTEGTTNTTEATPVHAPPVITPAEMLANVTPAAVAPPPPTPKPRRSLRYKDEYVAENARLHQQLAGLRTEVEQRMTLYTHTRASVQLASVIGWVGGTVAGAVVTLLVIALVRHVRGG